MGIVLCHKKIINLVVILILVFLLSLIIFSKYLKSFNIKRNYVIILLGIILLLLGRYLTISIENKYKLFEKSKEAVVISGRVTDFLESEYGTVVVVKNNDIYIYVYNVESTILEELKVGNQIKVYGEVRSMNVSRNPGNYNERDYLHSIKVGGKINAKSVQIVNRETYEIFVYTKKLQSFLCKQIDRIADSNKGGVLKAMLFGYRQDISEKLKEEYKMAGIFHLLSVSGLHISALGEIIFRLLKKRFQYYTATIFSGIIMFLFALMTGAGISTIRAVIMFGISLLARFIGLTYDIKSSLAIASLLMLLYNPYYLYNSSFQLSVMAIFSIVYIYNEIEKILKRHYFNKISSSFFVSLSVMLGTAPIIASIYFQIATYSVIINIIVIPLMTLILLVGFGAVLVSVFSTMAGVFFIGIDIYILKLYDFICSIVNKLPMNNICIGKMKETDVYIYYGILLLIMLILKLLNIKNSLNTIGSRNIINAKKLYAAAMAVLLVMLVMVILKKNNTLITFLDVGQGDCTFINIDGTTILIDGGSSDIKNVGKNRIVPAIKSYGYDYLDIVIVSHTDNDHISGILEIIENNMLNIKQVYIPDVKEESTNAFIDTLNKYNIPFQTMKERSFLKIKNAYFQALSPSDNLIGDINDKSLVLYCDIKGLRAVFTGDISADIEDEITKKYKRLIENINVLKVSHHGSKTGSCRKFISALKPAAAIISCGINNRYKHPHKETIDTLCYYNVYYEMTKEKGAVFIDFKGKKLLTDTYL